MTECKIYIESFFAFQKLNRQRNNCYEELQQRIERREKMNQLAQKFELQRNLMVSIK